MPMDRSEPQTEAEARLNAVSPSFCPSKWNDAYLHLHNGLSQACHYPDGHEVSPDALRENPAALHNTPGILAARAEMLKGVRPSECAYCWKLEDLGQESPRIRQTKNEWSEEKIAAILKDPLSERHRPENLEIGFSRACNFACVYCYPEFSSRWAAELKAHGPLPVRKYMSEEKTLHEKYRDGDNPFVKAFEKWLPEVQGSLGRLGITGGEPLLSAHTFRFLDHLERNPSPQLDLHINSNLGSPRDTIEDLVAKVKPLLAGRKIRSFKLYTSLESFGARAEYARYGLQWDSFWRNLEYVLEGLPEATVGFMSTFNLLSVSTFPDFLERLLEWRERFASKKNRITLSPNFLRNPALLAAQLAPPSLHPHLHRALEIVNANRNNLPGKEAFGFLQSELTRLQALVKWVEQGAPDASERKKEFYLYFSELDRRRGTSLPQTFPELAGFWEEGKAMVSR